MTCAGDDFPQKARDFESRGSRGPPWQTDAVAASESTPSRTVAAAVLIGVLALLLTLAGALPARAAGSWLDPVADRYEPGDVATLVGYVGRGQLGWVDDGPFLAYLRAGDLGALAPGTFSDQGLPVGHLVVDPLGGPDASVLRVSVSFRLPSTLPPGAYAVAYCNEPCTTGLGDLIGGRLSVGVDPPTPFVRGWPPDEPEVANLAPEALLAEGAVVATAEQVRTGNLPAPPVTAAPATTVAITAAARAPAGTVPVVRLPSPAPPASLSPRPSAAPADRSDGWFLLLGASLALVCTVSVVLALRGGRATRPAAPPVVARTVERVPAGRGV